MSKYKLVNGILYKDDNVMTICPIAPALLKPVQNSLGQRSVAIDRFTCSVNCPAFDRDGMEVHLTCPLNKKFTLESDEKDQPKSKSKLSIN